MAFDALLFGFALIAAVMGFRAGFLRSLATIFGYLVAAPFALGVAPALSLFLAQHFRIPAGYSGLVLALLLLLSGILMGWLFRRAVSELTGSDVNALDRLLGALLGVARIALVGVLLILIFDRVFPPNRAPGFLQGSKLRPYLSAAAEAGVKKLPPDVADYIDRLKRARGI